MPSRIVFVSRGTAATRPTPSRSFDPTLGWETGGQKSHDRCPAAAFSCVTRAVRWPGLSALTRGRDTSAVCPHAYSKRTGTTDGVVIAAYRDMPTRTYLLESSANSRSSSTLFPQSAALACTRRLESDSDLHSGGSPTW